MTGGVLVIGEALIDIVRDIDGRTTEVAGGSPANVALGLARQGVDVRLLTAVGRDAHGERIAAHLRTAGVIVDDASWSLAATSTARAQILGDGSAEYAFDVTWTLPDALGPAAVDLVHLGSISAFLEPGATTLEEWLGRLAARTLVTFDPNIRPDMIVRDLRLRRGSGHYYLASSPTEALAQYVSRTHRLGDVAVQGTHDLDIRSSAYDLSCDLAWDPSAPPANIGFEVCRAPGGGRHVAADVYLRGPFAYVNRRPTTNPTGGESQTPIDPTTGRLTLRILVDRTSVEVFVEDGRIVHSHRVFPLNGDDRVRLYAHEGAATFRNLTIREIRTR